MHLHKMPLQGHSVKQLREYLHHLRPHQKPHVSPRDGWRERHFARHVQNEFELLQRFLEPVCLLSSIDSPYLCDC